MSFSSDMRKIVKKNGDSLERISRATKLSLFSGVINDTRVDTGRLRGNWQTSTGIPKYATIDRIDKEGTKVIAEAKANITAFGVDYMTNNLPYAEVWEEKDGMIVKNIARLERNLKEAARSA